ncbi:hypothetical protein G5B38_16110 [Pseudohalocynthiibacter aestuariivivens]|nr:hypothetical protein [Pseudohalocynthiibacter aestuariivivens]QIE46920.1 hypothetical protein G5B38_16110 [Pseudohalocynthiibacter aestuariivivens]
MVRILFLFIALLVTACDMPSPEFRGVTPMRVKIAQSTFDVRVRGTRAEAIRVNTEWAPRLAATAPRGVAAIEVVSGCKVRKLRGDQAMMTAHLNCGGSLRPLPVPRPSYLDCGLLDLGDDYADLICEPVYQ